MLWFSIAWFCCQSFGDVSSYVCIYYFSSVMVAEWPPFGKVLITRFAICFFIYLLFEILVISRFGFKGEFGF